MERSAISIFKLSSVSRVFEKKVIAGMRAAVSSELLDKLGSKITGFHQLSGLHWS